MQRLAWPAANPSTQLRTGLPYEVSAEVVSAVSGGCTDPKGFKRPLGSSDARHSLVVIAFTECLILALSVVLVYD